MIEKNKFNQDEIDHFDQLVINDFSLVGEDTPQEFLGNHQLREKLKILIAHLLQHDFNRLVNAMYRLDVKESLFHEAMNIDDPEQVVDRLADIVFEREWQKVQTRLFFKRNK
jgi:hypothetical protein